MSSEIKYSDLPTEEEENKIEEETDEPKTPMTKVEIFTTHKKEIPTIFNQDMDEFYLYIYRYFLEKGFLSVLTLRFTKILTILLIITFPIFIILGIDWSIFLSCTQNCNFFTPFNLFKLTPLHITLYILESFAFLIWIYYFFKYCREVYKFYEIKYIYNNILEISEEFMETVLWEEILEKIRLKLFDNYRIHQINDANIANRIIRYENYLIGLIERMEIGEIMDLTLFSTTPIVTEAMIFNLKYLIKGMFTKHFSLDEELTANGLRWRIIIMAFVNIILSPFIFIYFLLFNFFKHFAAIKKKAFQFGSRKWSTYATWRFRYTNELPHKHQKRMTASFKPAYDYVNQFPSKSQSILVKFLMFLISFFASVLITLVLVNKKALESMLFGYDILYVIAIILVFWVSLKSFTIQDNTIYDPTQSMERVIKFTGYCPSHWKDKNHSLYHTPKIQKEFKGLFPYQIVYFIQEMFSIFTTPFFLLFKIAPNADRFLNFIKTNTIHIPDVGSILKSSDFSQDPNIFDDKLLKSKANFFSFYKKDLNESSTSTQYSSKQNILEESKSDLLLRETKKYSLNRTIDQTERTLE